jgi:glycosyltransferase involved in cell wall biosynthesis
MGQDRFAAIKDADVLVQTSLYECQSMTVNEGLAVGVPLVVTDSINYGEVESAGAGYVVPRDAAQLANAIDRILQAPDTNKRMREAGREFARTELLWTKIAATVEAAYGDAVPGLQNKEKLPNNWSETQIGVNA